MVTENESKSPGKLRNMVSYLSTMLSRAQLAWRAGLQFEGRRDLYQVLGYRTTVYYIDYLARYQRQDICRRIVSAPTLSTWENNDLDPIVVDGGNDTFNNAWQAITKALPIWSTFERADRMLALGQYAVLLLGFDDGSTLDRPITSRSGRKLLYVQPYSEGTTSVLAFDDNPASPRYGRPTSYQFTIISPSLTATGSSIPVSVPTRAITVDWSRCVHLAEDIIDSPIYGTPRLSAVFNLLDDLAKVSGGSAEAFWLIANRGMQADVDKEMELNEQDAENLQVELEEYQHQLRRFIRTRGVKLQELGSQAPRPGETFDMLIDLISATTGIPQRVLLGSTSGTIASQQDRANWAERISERRNNFATPTFIRPFVDSLVFAGVLPAYTDLRVKWPEAFVQNPLEKSQTSAQRARSVVNLSRQLSEGFPMITREEARVILELPPEPEANMGTIPEPLPKSQVIPNTSVVMPVPTGDQVFEQNGQKIGSSLEPPTSAPGTHPAPQPGAPGRPRTRGKPNGVEPQSTGQQ